jgi:hypothetical protein
MKTNKHILIIFRAILLWMRNVSDKRFRGHLQLALQPLFGFRPAQLSFSILSRKILQSAVASGTSTPQLGGEPGI